MLLRPPHSPGSPQGDDSPSYHALPVPSGPGPADAWPHEHGGGMGGVWAGTLVAQAWLRGAGNSRIYSPELRVRSVQFEEELICDYRFKSGYVYNRVH